MFFNRVYWRRSTTVAAHTLALRSPPVACNTVVASPRQQHSFRTNTIGIALRLGTLSMSPGVGSFREPLLHCCTAAADNGGGLDRSRRVIDADTHERV